MEECTRYVCLHCNFKSKEINLNLVLQSKFKATKFNFVSPPYETLFNFFHKLDRTGY
jgi:hypothetical protein